MKILCFKIYTRTSPITPYINRSCIKAFRELGHTVRVVDLRNAPPSGKERVRFIGERVLRFKPDFIFTINNQGIIPHLIEYLKIPYASWIVDTPFFSQEDGSCFGAIFLWEKGFIEKFKGFRYVGFLPACTDPDVFRKISLSSKDIERYGCNVSFVGSSFYSFYEKCEVEISKMEENKKLRFLFEEVMRKKKEYPLKDIKEILEGLNYTEEGDIELFLQGASVAVSRWALLEKVAPFGLSVYGDSGWKKLFVGRGVNLHPPIDYHREVPKLYNASKINLNISTPQRRTSLPPKIFDIAACEGFMLTDPLPELKDLFETNEEIAVYHSKEDLYEKVKYYLSHPEERKEIAQQAKKRVLTFHTYRDRMKKIIKIMKETF